MFKRVIQSVVISLFTASMVIGANYETYNNAEPIAVAQETEPVEVVMPEVTYIPNNTPVVMDAEPEEVVEEVIEEVEEPIEETIEPEITMSDEDIALIALVTMAEAEGESELGKRLVIDVILNRLDSDRQPNTVYEVVYAPGQWSSMWNGRVDECYVRDDICQLVREELVSRTNSEVLYFRTKHYHTFGTPLFQEGGHYFSTY